MNLTNLLTSTPAASLPGLQDHGLVAGTAAPSSGNVGSSSGMDFAQVLAQLGRPLPDLSRQQLAVDVAPQPGEAPTAAATGRSAARKSSTASDGVIDATGVMWPGMQPLPSPTISAPAPITNALPDVNPTLRSIDISPRLRVITDPRQAPDSQSLVAFAQSMGLDAQAVEQLLRKTSAPAIAPEPLATTTAPVHTPAPIGSATSTLASTFTTSPKAASTPQTTATPPAMPIGYVMPSATTIATSPPATVVLNLTEGTLNESDIAELAITFAQGRADHKAGRFPDEGTGGPSSDAPKNANLGDASPVMPNPIVASGTDADTQPRPATSLQTNMTEVYAQLGDKLATEMAASIHQQISNGEWRMTFGLRPAHLGDVQVQLDMKDGQLQATLQADNPLTRDLLQHHSQRLRESLENSGTPSAQVNVGHEGGQTRQQYPQHTGDASMPATPSPARDDASADTLMPGGVATSSGAKDGDLSLDLYA